MAEQMYVGHGHGRATAQYGQPQGQLHPVGGQAQNPAVFAAPRGLALGQNCRRLGPQQQRQGYHGDQHKDAVELVGLAPAGAVIDVAQHWRPDHAGHSLAGGDNGHRQAAPAVEPASGVCYQGRDHRRLAQQADQNAVGKIQAPFAPRLRRQERTHGDHHGTKQYGFHDTTFVQPPAHGQTADTRTQHHQGIGQGRHGPVRSQIGGDGL